MLQHIDYKEKMSRGAKELYETDPKQVMKYGWKQWDDILGGIFGGELIVLGGNTGQGKSTIINQIANNVAAQGFRVVKYSLENRLERAAQEELFYTCNRLRKNRGLDTYKWGPFISNEYSEKGKLYDKDFKSILSTAYNMLCTSPIIELDKDKGVTLEDLVELIEEEVKNGTKLFIIDHLHYFVFDDTSRLDIQITNVMHNLNEIVRKYNVAIILVAHYKNNTGWEKGKSMIPDLSYFKDAAAIKQVAHVAIQLTRDFDNDNYEEDKYGNQIEYTYFYFTKYRGPVQNLVIKGKFNLELYEYDFGEPSIEVKKQEPKFVDPFSGELTDKEKPF